MARGAWIVLGMLAAALVLGACDGGGASSSSASSSSGEAPPMPTPCSPASAPGGPYCLTFTGTQYASTHAGQKFEVSIVASNGTTIVATQTIAALPANGFFLNFPQVLHQGLDYYVDYYADESGDKSCEHPPHAGGVNPNGDHVWRSHTFINFFLGTVTTIAPGAGHVTGDMTWATQHDDPFLDPTTGTDMDVACNQLL